MECNERVLGAVARYDETGPYSASEGTMSGENSARLSYRSVFVSDLHLGSAACHADRLTRFLTHVDTENLYLLGDILDIWVGAQFRRWKQSHTDILRLILAKANTGTIVRYTPGNHDGMCRKLCGAVLGNVLVDHSFVHQTADGRRLLVLHGDKYDRIVSALKPLAILGAWTYEALSIAAAWLPVVSGGRLGGARNIADKAKEHVKNAVLYVTNFEDRVTVDARMQGYDGVVCGHVHGPALFQHSTGAVYANAGDWVAHCSAVVEHWDGRLELVLWDEIADRCGKSAGAVRAHGPSGLSGYSS